MGPKIDSCGISNDECKKVQNVFNYMNNWIWISVQHRKPVEKSSS